MKHKLVKWEVERERARALQRLESSTAVGAIVRSPRQFPPLVLCSSSLAFDTDEAMSASSKMAKDADEATSESSWDCSGKETGGALTWRVKWRRGHEESEKPEEADMEMDGDVPQDECVEIQSQKR